MAYATPADVLPSLPPDQAGYWVLGLLGMVVVAYYVTGIIANVTKSRQANMVPLNEEHVRRGELTREVSALAKKQRSLARFTSQWVRKLDGKISAMEIKRERDRREISREIREAADKILARLDRPTAEGQQEQG